MEIRELMWHKGIQFFPAKNRNEALQHLIRHAVKHPLVRDPKTIEDGILNRERVISTGIGLGVAIPHAKVPDIRDFFICAGILSEGVDWDSIDEEPVRIIILIIGPDNQQNQYLQILAKVSKIIREAANREKLLNAQSIDQVLQVFA